MQPLFAQSSSFAQYCSNFFGYWRRMLVSENGVVVFAVLMGIIGVGILMFAKRKL
jgi:hypothetical protein